MTRPFDPNRLQFYLTIPSPCPYLPDRMERKIFTQLDPLSGPHLNDYLTHAGFRRSQNVIYLLRKNADLTRHISEPYATEEQFTLLQRYLTTRHYGGGMSDMDFVRYEMMVEECASQTEIVEYRDEEEHLVACVLVDTLSDGLSMVYSFFDPKLSAQSLGKFMILDHIFRSRDEGLPFLYLGYWVPNSPKMDYKARFHPCQILGRHGWRFLETDA